MYCSILPPLKTSAEQFRVTARPLLGRAALLALVTWVARHHDGGTPDAAMTWAQLPAPTRRRIAVRLSHLLRRPLARAPVAEDLGHDRFPSGNEGRDVLFGEGSGMPSRSPGHRLRQAVDAATARTPP